MEEDLSKQQLWTKDFILIAAVNFLVFSSLQTLPFVLPVYLQTLGADDTVLGWVTAITTISALLIRPFCGIILDRFGRKGIFLAGIAFMGLASASFAFIPIVGIILAMRFVHGLAWGITRDEKEFFGEKLKILGLGLEDRMTSKVGLLSGGQRQALTLLMASLIRPEVLLLDEHTAALDPKTAAKVLDVTESIIEEQSLAAIMVTHNMKDAIRLVNV